MTGPEHYLKAEELLRFAANAPEGTTGLERVLAAAQVHATLALAVDHDTPLPYRTGDWVSRRGSQEIVRVTGVVYYGPLRGHIYTATGTRWGHGPAAPDEYELVHRDSTDTHGPTELQEGPDQ